MADNENVKKYMKNELRGKRSELKISQEKMAERLGVSAREYSDLENGKRFCSAKSLILYANECDINDKEKLFSDLGEIIRQSDE